MQIATILSPMSQLTILVAGHWRQKRSFAQKGSEPLATSRSLGMVQDCLRLHQRLGYISSFIRFVLP